MVESAICPLHAHDGLHILVLCDKLSGNREVEMSTKRLWVLLIVVAALAISACSPQGDAMSPATSVPEATTAQVSAAATTRISSTATTLASPSATTAKVSAAASTPVSSTALAPANSSATTAQASAAAPTQVPSTATAQTSPSATTAATEPVTLWIDVTDSTIGETEGWTNKVELADINGDDLVDLLFANGGNYDWPGEPEHSQVFLNQGPGQVFIEATGQVFGPTVMLARVIKVRDVNGDGSPDVMVGSTYQTQSLLYLGDGSGNFTDVTATHLPQIYASIGDLEFGDVDGDGDLDVALADWGPGNPMDNKGGRTMLWLNDGTGHFSDATDIHMPDVQVRFSWELEFVDIDNDYDLDILISCKRCVGSFLFENDGRGTFADVTKDRLPQFTNNYDFEAMDVNGDDYLDLVTINDGFNFSEHLFLNNQRGGFDDATEQLWPAANGNAGCDDNMDVFLDFDSDGDADLLIGSLDCPDRLYVNNGHGALQHFGIVPGFTPGTLGIAVADLNGDHSLDIVQAQGEAAFAEKVSFGQHIQPDTAPPIISLVEEVITSGANQPVQIRARVHDSKSPTMPHDWQSIVLRWTANGQKQETPMQWYGEYLWRGTVPEPSASDFSYQVCATDAAGNEACSPP
jgi:hypothetical protein